MATLTALRKLLLFALFTAPLLGVQWLLLRLHPPAAKRLPVWVHRVYCRILGIEVVRHGEPAAAPVLFASNHTSWLDIPILSTFGPVSFVAKQEVRSWPLFGLLARLQRTVFIERRQSRTTVQHRDEMTARLAAGDSLVLFPEGTSNDGNRVLPFKSAFFAVAEREIDGRPLLVQPVTIAYTRLDGMPIGRRLRHRFAWYGDMALMPHLWNALKAGRLTAEVAFHAPVSMRDFADRKALAAHAQAEVVQGLSLALSGRRPARPEAPAAPARDTPEAPAGTAHA